MTTHPRRNHDLRFGPAALGAVLLAAAGGPALACGPAATETSATEPAVPPPAADEAGAPPENADAGVVSADERPSFKHCVLHSGSAHRRGRDGVVQETACSLDAECFAMPGQATWDDGFVALACQGLECQCILSRALADSAAYTVEFTTAEPCADDEASHRLFFEHCMIGQELEPEGTP
jgi:hypothetical protein